MKVMKETEAKVEAEMEKRHFLELTERLLSCGDPAEIEQIKKELARLTFGAAVQS